MCNGNIMGIALRKKSDMARVRNVLQFLQIFLYFSIVLCRLSDVDSSVRDLDEGNWQDILEGEWMVEFYAPWCPACNALQPAWRELSVRAAKGSLSLRTAAVDVTKAPGLSGRFMVTALPTIFHMKDAELRQYKGPRDVEAMLGYVQQERWRQTEPVPRWKAPSSFQMTIVANFFKLSQTLRSVHTSLMETYGLPTWGSYLIFAVATIFIGALLGLVLVCIIDYLYPPKKHSMKVPLSKSEEDKLARGDQDIVERSDDDYELIHEDIIDDAVHDSDAEKNSPCDTTTDEEEDSETAAGDQAPVTDEQKLSQSEVRNRKPRRSN